MARLKVRLRGAFLSEVPLAENREYVAGRRDDADIRLEAEKGISREHFKIINANGSWTVEKQSRFGDVVQGGQKVEKFALEHGMTFSVPPYDFEFLMSSADEHQVSPSVDAVNNGDISSDFTEEKTMIGVSSQVPYIKVTDSSGEAKELIRLDGGDTYLAGRDPNASIQIRDSRVSRRQFEIRKNGSTFFIVDLGSVNGTLLNGNPLHPSEPVPMKSGDAITVLENFFLFELHDPNFKSRLELVNQNPAVPVEFLNPPASAGAPAQVPAPYSPGGNWVATAGQDPRGVAPYTPAGQPVAAPAKAGFDYKKNRPRLILGAIALIVVVYAITNQDSDAPAPVAANPMDPLAKLTPEQKKLAKDTLQLAKSYYMQGRYEFARSELSKMQEIIPSLEDSDGLSKLVTEAINVQQLQKKQEEMEKARADQEAKIQAKVAQCRKLINPKITHAEIEQCLSEVIAFDPSHPLFQELYTQADTMTASRDADAAKKASYRAEIEKMAGLYKRAKAIDSKKTKPLEAIDAYNRVVASVLPDPSGYRPTSRSRIAELKRQVNEKTAVYQTQASKFADEGKFKEAIIALRQAKAVDPQNPELSPKIESLKSKLQEQMMVIYQEGVLEENFGNIDGDALKSGGEENKAGAKQKWKQILRLDISDGEYFKKAYLKLKKYGVAE